MFVTVKRYTAPATSGTPVLMNVSLVPPARLLFWKPHVRAGTTPLAAPKAAITQVLVLAVTAAAALFPKTVTRSLRVVKLDRLSSTRRSKLMVWGEPVLRPPATVA